MLTYMVADVSEALRTYLPVILIVLGIFALALWIQIYILSLFRVLKSRQMKYFDEKVITSFEYLTFYLFFLVMLILAVFMSKFAVPEMEVVWIAISSNIKYGLAVFGIWLVALVVGAGLESISKYVRRGEPFTASLINLFFFMLKYTIYGIAIVAIILFELAFFGWESLVISQVSTFVLTNLADIIFLVIFVLISWFILDMIISYLETTHTSEKRNMPEPYNFLINTIRYIFLMVIGLVVIFTLLSMAGLQDIAYLVTGLIILLALIIGYLMLTGSSRNIVAGLLLMYYKPFEVRDRILFEDRIYHIQEIGLVYTELRTTDGVFMAVPNNEFLIKKVTNLTRSKKVITKVYMTLSSNVPLDRIRSRASSLVSEMEDVEEITVTASRSGGRDIDYEICIRLPLTADADRVRAEVVHSLASMLGEER